MRLTIIFILLIFSLNVYAETTMESFKSSPQNRWQFFTDQVMGGRSNGKLDFISEDNIYFARMTGDVTT